MSRQISTQKEEDMVAYFCHGEYAVVEEKVSEPYGYARHYLDMPYYPTFKLALSAEEKDLLRELDTGELCLESVNAQLRLTLNDLDR